MDVYRLELRCPDLKTQADIVQAKTALNSSPGFNTARFDLAAHELVVTTANQDKGRDVIYRLSHAGFPPEGLDANAFTAFDRE